MKTKMKYRIIALLMAPVFLVAISGWTLFIHYCTHCQVNTYSLLQDNITVCPESSHIHLPQGGDICVQHIENDHSCCKHHSLTFKVKSDYDKDGATFSFIGHLCSLINSSFLPFKVFQEPFHPVSLLAPPNNRQLAGAISSSMRL